MDQRDQCGGHRVAVQLTRRDWNGPSLYMAPGIGFAEGVFAAIR
jgi:hypothetical protein